MSFPFYRNLLTKKYETTFHSHSFCQKKGKIKKKIRVNFWKISSRQIERLTEYLRNNSHPDLRKKREIFFCQKKKKNIHRQVEKNLNSIPDFTFFQKIILRKKYLEIKKENIWNIFHIRKGVKNL